MGPMSTPLARLARLARGLPTALTLLRAAGAGSVGIAAVGRLRRSERYAWSGRVVAGLALCESLDGVDGWSARRLDAETRVGAALDAEADALTMLSLSLALRATGAPGWVLTPGLLRYGWGVATLTRGGVRLPARRSRRWCAAAGAIGLIAALAADSAGLAPRHRDRAAAAATVVLVCSFARDVPALLGFSGTRASATGRF